MKIIDKKLKNGIKLRILNSKEFKSSRFDIQFTGGFSDVSGEKNQVPHVLEHMLCAFSKEERDQFALAGAIRNAYTSHDATCYFVESLPEYFENLVDLILLKIENPPLTEEILSREKGNARSEFARASRDLQNLNINEKYREIFPQFIPHYNKMSLVDNVSLADIEDFYTRHMVTANAQVFISGNFSDEEISKILARIEHIDLPRGEKIAGQKMKITDKVAPRIDSDELRTVLSFVAPLQKITARRRAVIYVLRDLLFSINYGLIYREVRENGLTYAINFRYDNSFSAKTSAFIAINFTTNREKFNKTVEIFKKWIEEISSGKLDEEVLQKAKITSKNTCRMALKNPEASIDAFRKAFFGDFAYDFREAIELIDAVSIEDIAEILKEIFANFGIGEVDGA